jgi:hypothetical protein
MEGKISVIGIHSRLGITGLLSTIVMGAWGLWRYLRRQNVDSVLVLPGIFAFRRGQAERRSVLVYGAGFLFLAGIVLRAITTSGRTG